jgi:group I intron endonuclease
MTCGVYEIWIGNYFYQGSSQDIEIRINHHKNALERGAHSNRKMQNVWNKYKLFEYQILVECNDGLQKSYEQDYIDSNWEDKFYLNLNNSVYHPDRTGAKHTQESINKMKESLKGKIPWNKGRTDCGGYKINYTNITCPFCGKEGRPVNMKRFHFDMCKEKK